VLFELVRYKVACETLWKKFSFLVARCERIMWIEDSVLFTRKLLGLVQLSSNASAYWCTF